MQSSGEPNNGVGNSSGSATGADVTINIPDEVDTNAQQVTDVQAVTSGQTSPAEHHDRSCCMKARMCLESCYFSFLLGALFFLSGIVLISVSRHLPTGDYYLIGPFCIAAGIILIVKGCISALFFGTGITLIAVSTQLPGDYFLIGPFCIAAGTILFIRGCINRLALKQQQREQAEREERIVNRALTRAQRSQRNEELALSQENLIIPPNYFEVVERSKPPEPGSVRRQLVHTESQTMFDLPPPVGPSTISHPALQRLTSVQSQTSFPSTVSVGVDTSDLPAQLGTATQAPPSYERATTRPPSVVTIRQGTQATSTQSAATLTDQDLQPATVSYYLPTEEDEVATTSTSTSTATQSTGT